MGARIRLGLVALMLAALSVGMAPSYTLRVVNGSGGGSYTPGSTVSIAAATPATGYAFSTWSGAAVASPTSSSTTLVMPSGDAVVIALYVPTNHTYYVSTSGNDGNSCTTARSTTQSSQKRTISAGVSCLAAGDNLYVHGGTYNENVTIPSSANGAAFGTSCCGWPGATVVASYPGETVWLVPSSGSSAVMFPSSGTARSYQIWSGINTDGTNTDGSGALVFIGHNADHIRWQDSETLNPYWLAFDLIQGSDVGTINITTTYTSSGGGGNTYFVSTSGNDSNSCTTAKSTTQSNQKRHIASGVACLSAGDTLYVHAGTYTATSDIIDSTATTVPAGTDWNTGVITIGAYPSETVTIQPPDGSDGIRIGSGTHNGAIGEQYIIFQDFILDGVNQTNDQVPGAVFNGGANHIRLLRLEIKNWVSDGILTSDHNWDTPWASYFEFINNVIHNNGRGTGNALIHGIYIGSSNNLADGNISYHNSGFGIQADNNVNPAWRPASNNIIRNNTLYDNGIGTGGTGGVVVAYGTNNQVYDNVIYGNNGGGILVYANSSNTMVYNNTVYNNSPYAGVNVQFIEGDVIIRNNILYSNTEADIQNDGGFIGGSIVADHNLNTDPSFVNAGSANFQLQSGSTAIGAGINAGIIADITGFAQTTPLTIGAYVFH